MPALTEDQKDFIVRLLAAYETPTAVAARLWDECGVQIDRSQVIRYDPTKPCFEAGDRWRAVFDAARKVYSQSIEAIPIAHKAYRLNELQRNFDRAQAAGNLRLANATLRQAADEAGGGLTNEQNVRVESHSGSLSPDERRAAFTDLIQKALQTPMTVLPTAA